MSGLRKALFGLTIAGLTALPGTVFAGGVTHHIKTVFIILMENHNWTGDDKSIENKKRAHYINDVLIPMASHAEQYYNPPGMHPSLPNYLWLEAGTNFGILRDGEPKKNGQDTTQHLVTLLGNCRHFVGRPISRTPRAASARCTTWGPSMRAATNPSPRATSPSPISAT